MKTFKAIKQNKPNGWTELKWNLTSRRVGKRVYKLQKNWWNNDIEMRAWQQLELKGGKKLTHFLASRIQIFLLFLFSNFISIVFFLLPFYLFLLSSFFYFSYFLSYAFLIEGIIISATLIFDMIIVQFLPIFRSVC